MGRRAAFRQVLVPIQVYNICFWRRLSQNCGISWMLWGLSAASCPRINCIGTRIAEFVLVACNNGKSMTNCGGGNHCIWQVTVKGFTSLALRFHDASTDAGIGYAPFKNSLLENIVEQSLEPLGNIIPALSPVESTDAIENFPDCDG